MRRPLRALRMAAAILALLALLMLTAVLARGVWGIVTAAFRAPEPEPDPMFASEEPAVTRPPQLTDEGEAPVTDGDPSEHWVYRTLTPIEP